MNRLIAISIVKNEENNYLADWLRNLRKFVDYHIFLDDASDDKTPDIIQNFINSGYKGEIHRRKESLFAENEPALRSELWQYTRKFAENGDWILIVDADEFYDKRLLSFKQKIPYLNKKHYECVKVSCRDMWTKNKYRCDGYWSPKGTDVRLIAFQDLDFCNNGNNLHLPCYPAGLNIKNNYKMFIPKIHLAYLREKDRKRRYEFYTNAKNTDAHSIKHAKSILEVKPKLKNLYNSFELILDKLFSIYENPMNDILNI